jgi:dynein heavy chain 2
LLLNEDRLKSSLVKLEDELLEELGSSSGNILENKSLLDNLTKTKSESLKIAQSLKESEELNAKLDLSRDIYRPLSKKGAVLFLKISQLGKVNNMYRFSLGYFIRLFLTCLEDGSEKGKLSIAKKDNR